MPPQLSDILKKLGWDDGFQIPIANDENKALEEELAKLSLRKTKGKTTLEIVSGRYEALRDHFKYVTQENEQTQKLITAHKQQLECMENEYHVIKSEKENTQRSTKDVTNRLRDSSERQNSKKSDLQKGVIRADQLKAEMDWDAEALKAWEESLKKRDDDIELLKKFSKEDERRFNELEAKRQLLQAELAAKRGKIAKISANVSNYELVVERSGKVMKQLMAERDALISQWKDTVKMLQQRDKDIMNAQDQIANVHEMIQQQAEKLEDENTFLKNEQRNNRELEMETQSLNALNSRMRTEFGELTQHMLLLSSELHTMKRNVAATAHHLENERIKAKRLDQMYLDKESLSAKYHEDIDKLQQKMNEMKESTMSSEERIRRIEKLIEKEEKLHDIFLGDTEKLNGVMYRSEQVLKDLKSVGKLLEIDINNVNCNCVQLRKHIQAKKKEVEKIKEVVYDMEFRIDEKEKKLYKILDDSKLDEMANHKDKIIQDLDKTLSNHRDVQHVLQNQVDRLQEEMRRLSNLIAFDKEISESLRNKCENHLLVYEIGQKQMAAAKKSTQEKQVEENMMRLRISRIEIDKKKEEKQIFTLEKLRLNLDQVMKERQLEIDTQKTITQTKKRNLEEDRGRLKSDIALRRLKIEQIQKKYHIALVGLGKDEDGQTLSVTHFKIKNAQEKFILQQQGDELDQKIKTAEKEIVAMENTLKLMNVTNTSFKNSLAPVNDDDEEVKEMEVLNEKYKELADVLKSHKNEYATAEKNLEELTEKLNEIEQIRLKHLDVVTNLEDEIISVRKQEQEKAEKLTRVEGQLKKLLKKIGKRDISRYNRDFEIRQLQEVNRNVLQCLTQLTSSHSEITPLFNRYIMEYNIELPEKRLTPSSNSSDVMTSTRSSSRNQNSERSDGSAKEAISVSTLNLSLDF
ncbi:unnamed protein product [Phaedon cochleariae]|uniref:Coiled-coil domain-containing protein 39 n=1 Tax=Phaedon cochleariae TaxID=80249 RepID=A0A9P0DSF0_PHACE|nr:unnamed protein product [Phaedon cochleariae]